MAVGEVQGRLNLIWNLVMGIMTAAGAIVLAWGIFEFASSYQHHDTSGRTSALKKVISGILMILGELVFQMLGWIPT
jgi:hypothetical protein